MLAKLIFSVNISGRTQEIDQILKQRGLRQNHPDLMYFDQNSKLGIKQTREMIQFLSIKPFQAKGRCVAIEDASMLTIQAQNSLLKTLEELPLEAVFIMGVKSEADLLPTLVSRCQLIFADDYQKEPELKQNLEEVENLFNSSIQSRFLYIEKSKDKKELLESLISYTRSKLLQNPKDTNISQYLQLLLQAQEWVAQNVNLRAILEYLMLTMPKIRK